MIFHYIAFCRWIECPLFQSIFILCIMCVHSLCILSKFTFSSFSFEKSIKTNWMPWKYNDICSNRGDYDGVQYNICLKLYLCFYAIHILFFFWLFFYGHQWKSKHLFMMMEIPLFVETMDGKIFLILHNFLCSFCFREFYSKWRLEFTISLISMLKNVISLCCFCLEIIQLKIMKLSWEYFKIAWRRLSLNIHTPYII